MSLQSEMPRIVEDDLRAGIIPTKGFRSGREKERVVFPPYRQRRRQMRAEELLKLGIELDVVFVVTDEIELNLGALWTIQQSLVEKDGFTRNAFLSIGHAVLILPTVGFHIGMAGQDIPILVNPILP